MENSSLAGFGNRLVAQIIDSLILGLVISALILPIFGVSVFNSAMADAEDEAAIAVLVASLVLPLVLARLVAPILYEAFYAELFQTGYCW